MLPWVGGCVDAGGSSSRTEELFGKNGWGSARRNRRASIGVGCRELFAVMLGCEREVLYAAVQMILARDYKSGRSFKSLLQKPIRDRRRKATNSQGILPEEFGAGLKEGQFTVVTITIDAPSDNQACMHERLELDRYVLPTWVETRTAATLCVHSIRAHDERQP